MIMSLHRIRIHDARKDYRKAAAGIKREICIPDIFVAY
jgi:hypothetical protein